MIYRLCSALFIRNWETLWVGILLRSLSSSSPIIMHSLMVLLVFILSQAMMNLTSLRLMQIHVDDVINLNSFKLSAFRQKPGTITLIVITLTNTRILLL